MDDDLMEARRWVKAERGLKKLPDPDHSAVVARLAEMEVTLEKQVAEAALPIVLEGNAFLGQIQTDAAEEAIPHVASSRREPRIFNVTASRKPAHIPQPMREGPVMSRQVRRQLERLAGKPRRPVSQMQALGLHVYGEQKA